MVNIMLVAYDDPSSATLARAADYARALGSTLIVTNVAAPTDADREESLRLAAGRLDEARAYLFERGVAAKFVPTVGPPADAIVRLAEERAVDLIVVGSRHKGFLERLVEGSVAQDVLRRAGRDVLIVD